MEATRIKVAVSAVILLVGLAATVALLSSSSTDAHDSGLIVDFGDYRITYTSLDSEEHSDPFSALSYACGYNGFDLVTDGPDVVSIDGVSAQGGSSWGIYGVISGDTEWTVLDGNPWTYSMDDYAAVCWGYCAEGGEPTVAVDGTGVCFYGYDIPRRVVTISPSSTETFCAVGGLELIVGTDMYSNYPEEVVRGQEDGSIAIVGGFTNPSYEMVLLQDPDLVVCLSNQSVHLQMASNLRAHGVDVLVLDGGESVEAVMDNIYMAGAVIGNAEGAADLIGTTRGQIAEVESILDSDDMLWDKRVMVALSALQSPWVSGSDTYISDVLLMARADNIYSGESGWVQVNAETIARYNPEVILVVSSDYEATQSDYDSMMASLSSEWRTTDAYRNGEVYLLTGDANDLVSRPGPRVAEITELMAKIVHGSSFTDGIAVPKYIGDDYEEYLTITRGDSP